MNRIRSTLQSGFTVIELVVVIVVIGILLTVVFVTQNGVAQQQRDDERRRDIAELRSNLEGYYAQHDKYPSLKELNSSDWRQSNLKSLDSEVLSDPLNPQDRTLAETPRERFYSYAVRAADGNDCDNQDTPCTQYTLSAQLENGTPYTKNNLN